MDNQFINAQLLSNRSGQYTDPKDELIKKLQLKNRQLKTQLIKIQKTIEEKLGQPQEPEGPKRRESLFQSEDNYEVLTKELANTYKRIKMYEYQVSKHEDSNRSVNVSQKTTQYQLIIKEKKGMSEKLRLQLAKEQKTVLQNTRRLQNNNPKDEHEHFMKKLSQESKFYRQKIKYIQEREATKVSNMKKQYQAIKKFQNLLLEAGLAGGELEDIKRNAIKCLSISPAKQTMSQTKQQSREEIGMSESQQEIEDRTKQHYLTLISEIALLQKMQTDHQKQITQALDQKVQAINKNTNSRNKLLECEHEIEHLEKEIQAIKSRVVPSNMKPLKPLRSMSSVQGQNPQKLLPAKSFGSPIKNKSLIHLLKYDEVGLSSSMGQRFTDRVILGKNSLTLKITSLKVYVDKTTNLIAGIQCIYTGNKQGADHIRKDKDQKESQYKQQKFICKGACFIRSISGSLNPQDKLQFLTFTSSDGSSFRVGTAKSVNKSFSLDIGPEQYPTCVFGSLVVSKEPGKKESSIIEHFGFEIQRDNVNSNPKQTNEFNE